MIILSGKQQLLPKEHRWVNQEWVIFNRTHAEVVASDSYVVDIVSRHRSDSESYFSILLSFYGYLHDSNVVDRQTTYVNWVFGKDGHPYMFRENNEFTLSLMQEAKAQGSLFARKFSRSFPEKDLKEFIKKEPK